MADEDRKMPAGMAGITNYSDVNPEKISLKPEHVVAIVVLTIFTEAALYLLI